MPGWIDVADGVVVDVAVAVEGLGRMAYST